MSNFLLMKSGYEPVNIQAESRARYIAAIRAFQEADDPYPFAAFFCLNLVERLQKVLGLLTGSGDGAAEWRASGLEGYLSGDDGALAPICGRERAISGLACLEKRLLLGRPNRQGPSAACGLGVLRVVLLVAVVVLPWVVPAVFLAGASGDPV
jgi:hypothetical protein